MGIFDKILGRKEKGAEKPEKKKKPEFVDIKKETRPEKKPVVKAEIRKEKRKVASRKVAKKDENVAHKILFENLISEKSTMLAAENKYVFRVQPKASKYQIREAVEGYYGVQVIGVNTIKISPKKRIQGRKIGG